VRPSNGYQPADAIAIRDDILERVGRFDIEVVEAPEIPKTLQGKTILVVRLEERLDMRQLYAPPLLKKKESNPLFLPIHPTRMSSGVRNKPARVPPTWRELRELPTVVPSRICYSYPQRIDYCTTFGGSL